MKTTSLIIIFILLSISGKSQTDIDELKSDIVSGRYNTVIEKVGVKLKSEIDSNQIFELLKLKSEAYLNLNYITDYLRTINQSVKYNLNKKTAETQYKIELAIYYHRKLITDSSTFFAHQAMQLLYVNKQYADSSLISKVYANYANAMRNGGNYHKEIIISPQDFKSRNNLLKSYLDTAMIHATTKYQKADIYHKIATLYLDCIANYDNYSCMKEVFVPSNNFYYKEIKLLKNNSKIASAYALIGLNYHYLHKYKEADSLYQLAEKYTKKNDVVIYMDEFIAIQNWRGWNLVDWHAFTDNITLLKEAHSVYKNSLSTWSKFYDLNKDNSKGYNDGYQTSSLSQLVSSSYDLFKKTSDNSYLHEAFNYAEQAKYATFKSKLVSIQELQALLSDNTAFVHLTSVPRPDRNIVFIILKSKVFIFETASLVQNPYALYQFENLLAFKRRSYAVYQLYFEKIDSILTTKNIKNVIISNTYSTSTLNLDVLISDTLSSKWKDQPYLFHKYNFSYAFSGRSYVESYHNSSNESTSFGLTIGNYTKETNLRFSTKLVKKLPTEYKTNISDFQQNIHQNNISMTLLHGNSSYSQQTGEVMLSSTEIITADNIFNKKLNNDLIIFTACNTNASQQYNGEGATGNFAKAFRYAGSKSVLTTSWSIDDKSNAFIIERFIRYLSEGMRKNDALWQSKKDYWNQSEIDEEFSPLYWAPYVLTGNTKPVRIEKKETVNLNWLWLLMTLPIAYITWRKFS